MKTWTIRIEKDELATSIDQRADEIGVSRNEWINRALTAQVQEPIREIAIREEV